MIRTLFVQDENGKDREVRVGWIHDKPTEKKHAHFITHDINQDAQGIIDDMKEAGYNYTLIGELEGQS